MDISSAEGDQKWPVKMALTANDVKNNCFTLFSGIRDYINKQLVQKEIEVFHNQGSEILLHDSDTEKPYPGCQLVGLTNKNIYSSYYLRGTAALVKDRKLNQGDTVGFKYNHHLGVMYFCVLQRKNETPEENNDGGEDTK